MFYFQGLLWGLACIVAIYDDVKIPYVKGENYTSPTSAKLTYTTMDSYPSDLAIMGIMSFCLTLVNIVCIFVTAIIVLKVSQTVFWDVTRCGLIDITLTKHHFSVACCVHIQVSSTLKMENVCSSDTLAPIYQCTRCHIPKTTMLLRTPEVKSHVIC
jgi:hypothetical protein